MLLTSGDTVGQGFRDLVAGSGLELLHKPFDLDELRQRVRRRLSARPRVE
jgi:hypothetical protein